MVVDLELWATHYEVLRNEPESSRRIASAHNSYPKP